MPLLLAFMPLLHAYKLPVDLCNSRQNGGVHFATIDKLPVDLCNSRQNGGVHFATTRRAILFNTFAAVAAAPATARTPGSDNVDEAIAQIKDGSAALKRLREDWAQYACVDKEGRACNIDAARKILGGVAPQRGDAAIEVAQVTPLYRIDGAFNAVRKYALGPGEATWGGNLDIEEFCERGEDIVFALKKVDDSFYGVVFASKGSTMIENIYKEALSSVDAAIRDFDKELDMLKAAKAPGFE